MALFISYVKQNMDYIPKPSVLTLDPNDDNIILEIPEDKDPNEKSAQPAKKEKVLVQILQRCFCSYNF